MVSVVRMCKMIKIRDVGFLILGVALFMIVFFGLGYNEDASLRYDRANRKSAQSEYTVHQQEIVPEQRHDWGHKEPERHDGDLFLIPGDDVLKKMSEAEILKMYWRYINGLQTVCNNIVRFGSLNDGGKDICLEQIYVPPKPCIAYSFGCGFHFEFENAVHDLFGCTTFTFDPTINIKGKEHLIPKHVNLTLEGLSGKDETQSNGWKMKTLKTILKERNHEKSVIDLLKIDIEGSEWSALMDTFKTDILSRVRQLSMEVHFARFNPKNLLATQPLKTQDPLWGGVPVHEQLAVLRILYEKGFRIFMREHNINSICKPDTTGGIGAITTVNELYFVNKNFRP